VAGFIAAAEHPEAQGQVINLGTGREISIGDLAQTILNLLGKEVSIEPDDQRTRPEASEVDRLCADITRARQVLGWRPQYSLEEGLCLTIAWIKDNLASYRPEMYNL
jgi:dTDP-glucose 4,6-dehydratase